MDESALKQILESAVETRRHFDVTAERIEKKVELLAEGVAHVDQGRRRDTESLREDMKRGFSDTQAMIKFSHAELDRRVRALEDGLSVVQARLDRLESSTH